MRDIDKAKAALSGEITLALVSGTSLLTSSKRGIRPLLDFLDTGMDFSSYSAADKVVGRGAAYLYVILGIKEVFASVISASALSLLEEYGVKVECERTVERILNRTGDGFCPIESCVMDITDKDEALEAIRKRLEKL